MKKKILPIILSIFVLVIMALLIVIINNRDNIDSDIEVTIALYSEEKDLISRKEIKTKKECNFLDLLKANYEIEMRGTLLVRIDSLFTPNTNEKFIKIYHNCAPSTYGVGQMKIQDQDEIIFIIEEVKTSGDFNAKFC